jgi:hypothetical protein
MSETDPSVWRQKETVVTPLIRGMLGSVELANVFQILVTFPDDDTVLLVSSFNPYSV